MRILITGGAGFIGSHVAERYLALGHEVAVLDDLSTGRQENVAAQASFHRVDLRDPSAVERVFSAFRPEIVNHHAAQMSVPLSVDDPALDASINLVGFLHLMESGRRAGTRKILFASSGGTVYGEPEDLPCREDHPASPMNPYGIAKHTTEHYLDYYARQHGIAHTSLRYANVYGPRQLAHGEAGVVAIFCRKMLDGETPTIFGDGEHVRDYVYVSDVVEANVLALDRGEGEAVNIGTGVPTTTRDLYRAVGEAASFSRPPAFGPARRGDARANYLRVERAQAVLGWRPKVGLREGIRLTFSHFRSLAT